MSPILRPKQSQLNTFHCVIATRTAENTEEFKNMIAASHIDGRFTLVLLKKSVTDYLTWFSWVALPLTEDCERFAGRSARSNFLRAN